jgi:phosphopentomutase
MPSINRVILIVLDSLGIGASKDAHRFGDETANTFLHISEFCKKNSLSFELPHLSRWGFANFYTPSTYGLKASNSAWASTARLSELSPGKDTTTGHWELAGTVLKKEFPAFEKGFDVSILKKWCELNHLPGYLGNYAASGTTIIEDLGEEHLKTGKPIVYTSADSVFQVAWSEEKFGLQKLYDICLSARKLLDPLGIGRIIARPFIGNKKGQFKRTENRRDYSVPPPYPNILDRLRERNFFVGGVGKIEDIFAHRSVNKVDHTGNNEKSLKATLKMMNETQNEKGLIFTNLIDFDQLHGHRRNPKTYAEALVAFDQWLPQLENNCLPNDLVILTADHGNDPTHRGSDHTREDIPLLFWTDQNQFKAKHFGNLEGFTVVARLVLESLGLEDELINIPDTQTADGLWAKIFFK